MNQRALIRMTEAEVQAFLSERRTMALSTIGADGLIHSAAMWYGLLDGQVALLAKRRSQKTVNALRDGRLTGLIEDGSTYRELRGVCLAGRAIVETAQQVLERAARSLFDRYAAADATFDPRASTYNRVVLRLQVERVISWDHRKLLDVPPRMG